MLVQTIPRPEYPRPQLVRGEWMNLNGIWEFETDPGKSGRERGLPAAEKLAGSIQVPFCPESRLSGVGCRDFMECVWYRRTIALPDGWMEAGRRVLLHIGACDYRTEVWVNGHSAGVHIGGYVSFSMDITAFVSGGNNTLVVCAEDELRTGSQPAGKQSPAYDSYGCMYTRTTGIWQTVWLESVPDAHIQETVYIPCMETQCLHIEAVCRQAHGLTFRAEASFEGRPMGSASATVVGRTVRLTLPLRELRPWSPETPALYDLHLTLGGDRADSYFGMREVAFHEGKLLLNGRPIFQRLVLDQGYYPDGLYTAPSDQELEGDIRRGLAMGFNGARLHQKVFEPRFLYHCDRLGYLVWGEQGNWGQDTARPGAWQGFLPEWLEVLKRDINHPALIGWCPLNETQNNQNPHLVKMIVDMTRRVDPTRLVIDASGWTHQGDLTDILDAHDYEQDPVVFREKYLPLTQGKAVPMLNQGEGRPAFISEYGGIWWSDTEDGGWGYGDRPRSREEALERYSGLTAALLDNPAISGFCYTQLTDVEQEQNGLYTYDRRPKFDPADIAAATARPAACEKMAGIAAERERICYNEE